VVIQLRIYFRLRTLPSEGPADCVESLIESLDRLILGIHEAMR
jgi:hypothetical protein